MFMMTKEYFDSMKECVFKKLFLNTKCDPIHEFKTCKKIHDQENIFSSQFDTEILKSIIRDFVIIKTFSE